MQLTKKDIYALIQKGERLHAECKEAFGGMPDTLWESYSSFANTDGGVIEKCFRQLSFANPGSFLISKEDAIAGGNSEPRNEKIFNIFALMKINTAIATLIKRGLLRRVGPKKGGHWADYDKDEKAKGEKKPGDFVTGRARAEAFAAWLNGKFKSKLPRGYVFRLPTEAEWEHAQQAGAIGKNYDFEGTLDTAKAIAKKANAWRFENSVMNYDAVETDPIRLCELNPAWVCRQNVKRFLLPFDGGATFRMTVGPDLLAEKKK